MKYPEVPKTYFWAYDIFGYLLPGGTFLVGLMASNFWIRTQFTALSDLGRFTGELGILVLAYIVGHVLAAMSSLFLEKCLLKWGFKYPTEHLFSDKPAPKWKELLSGGYLRPYTTEFQELFKERFRVAFGERLENSHDLFWLTWSYVSLHHPIAYRRATHFLDLYGFSRNLSMALFVLALSPLLPSWTGIANGLYWFFGFGFLALLMFMNYTKLLRRLNDEVYRGFVAVGGPSPIASAPNPILGSEPA